ncbi:IclR family transcriptional regulator [Sporosarcina sp. P3]|uniref:IclR family transcriptional regulator n=1 Tax=Sporosarcina sp. P3 TaxID=2048245 RepID=UPI00130440B5|nr:IclR family transcriptional regulator [Sporosarcina sp. P3]
MENGQIKTQGIQTVERTALILQEMKNSNKPLTLTELSKKVVMSKNNLKKYLVSFVRTDFVTFNESNKTYDLGPKLIELGLHALGKHSVISMIDPFMLKIKNELKYSSALAIWSSNGPVISKYQSSGRSLNVEIKLGYHPPLLKSSIGRCFASFLPKHYTEDIMANEMDFYKLSKESVEEDLSNIRSKGFASRDETSGELPGSLSIAVPIFNYDGEIVAAICILGFASEFTINEQSNEVQKLRKIAKEVSDQLAYI